MSELQGSLLYRTALISSLVGLVLVGSLLVGTAPAIAQSDNETISGKSVGTQSLSIEYGETISSELDQNDAFDESLNGYHENYTFTGDRGDQVSLEMRPEGGPYGTAHAAQFRVFGPDGDLIEFGGPDNANGYADSRGGSTSDLDSTFELPSSGTYTIVATTDDPVTGTTGPENPAYETREESYTDTFSYELRLHQFAGEPTPVQYNSTVNSTLSAQSNFNDALNGYYDVYSFEGDRGDLLSLEMRPEGGPYDVTHAAQFRVFGPDGDRIEFGGPDNANGYADSRGDSTSDLDTVFELPSSGTYTIVATTDDAVTGTFGPDNPAYESQIQSNADTFDYELRLHEFAGEATPIEYNSSVNSTLSTQSNFNDALNGYYNVYSFDAEQGDQISLEMRPEGGPYNATHAARFLIFGPDGDRIEIGSTSNANGYADTFSNFNSPDSVFTVSTSGAHTIVATTDDAATGTTAPDNPAYSSEIQSNTDTFDYELRLHEFAGEATPIEYNSSVNSTLSTQSNFNDALNGYYNVYSFDAEQGDQISLEMRPEGGPYNATHAARFLIFGPDGDRIEIGSTSNANGYADTFSNFNSPDSVFTVSTSGAHTIVATTDDAATGTTAPDNPAYSSEIQSNTDTFDYELRLHEFAGEATPIEYNSSINGTLSAQSNFNDALNGYYDVYSFDAEQSGDIWAELSVADGSNPENHATRIEIYGPSGQRVASDSTEDGTSSITSTSVSTGEHTVVVTTTDSGLAAPYDTDEESQTATYNYRIAVTDGPKAAFNASPAGDGSIQFDAESSSLPGGEITQYEWDFDEDGDIESSGETATYTYNTSGEFNVTLTVTAASGATDTITKTVTSTGANTAPTAAFTYSPSTPEVGDTVRFDANQSSDPDGTIANFNWDLNGDGSNEAAGVTTTQTYEEPGIYNVTLRVTDNGDKTASITQSVRVTESSGPGDVTGTGNKAKDPDNDGVYEDINGDGEVDVFDVQALYSNLDTDTVQNYPEAFNFAGDDNPTEVTIFDVQALFRDL